MKHFNVGVTETSPTHMFSEEFSETNQMVTLTVRRTESTSLTTEQARVTEHIEEGAE